MIEINADGTYDATPHYHRRDLEQMARQRGLAVVEAHGWWLLIDANGDVVERSRDFNALFWQMKKNTLAAAPGGGVRLAPEEAVLVAGMTERAARRLDTLVATAVARGDRTAATAARNERILLDALAARLGLTLGVAATTAPDGDAWAAAAAQTLQQRPDVEAAEALAEHLRLAADGAVEERLLSDAARVLAVLADRLRAARKVGQLAVTLASGIGTVTEAARRTAVGEPVDRPGGR